MLLQETDSVCDAELLSKRTLLLMRLLLEKRLRELLWSKDHMLLKEPVRMIFCRILVPLSINSFLGHARMSGPYGNRGSNESREQTIANGTLALVLFFR